MLRISISIEIGLFTENSEMLETNENSETWEHPEISENSDQIENLGN